MCEPIYCEACGVIQEQAMRLVAEQEETIVRQAKDRNRLQKLIDQLRKKGDTSRPVEYEDAMEIAVYWKEKVAPLARELEGPRLDKTIARLKHYSKEELLRAVFGYSCRPHRGDYGKRLRMSEGGKWDADLEKIMQSGKTVEAGIRIANEELRFDQGVLNQGGRRVFAELCDCGHPRVEHGMLWLQGHESCCDKDCGCRQFDDITQRSEEFLRNNGYQLSASHVPDATRIGVTSAGFRQESLL